MEATRIADRTWYRKITRMITKQQLEKELQEKLARGEITSEEAENEWQDFTHRDEGRPEW